MDVVWLCEQRNMRSRLVVVASVAAKPGRIKRRLHNKLDEQVAQSETTCKLRLESTGFRISPTEAVITAASK